jgi:two-component system chemotaxis response regulator CheB
MDAAHNGHTVASPVQRDLVVIGASAGGVDGLQQLVKGLPPEFPAAILVVLHVPSTGTSVLPQILSRHGPLDAVFATDGMACERGQIYVAPADHHLLVHDGRLRLSQGPRENGHRPAIDPLFRSAARACGPRCIGVVMSGLLDDGASGLRFIKDHGGAAVVQDPDDAMFPSMPRAALDATEVDGMASAADMPALLGRLIDETLPVAHESARGSARIEDGDGEDRVEMEDPAETAALVSGPPSALTCPECGGALWEHEDGGATRYACHVGHAYSLGSLVEEQGRSLETTLWSAVRSLEERADVHHRLSRRAAGNRAGVYESRAKEAEDHARTLRKVLGGAGRIAAPTSEQA